MYIYSSKESFINKGKPFTLKTQDFIKEKMTRLSNFEQHAQKAKELQNLYNKTLGDLKNPKTEMGKIQELLINEINAQIEKYHAKVTPGNILKAISSQSQGGALSAFADQAKRLSLLSSKTGTVQLKGLQKRLRAIENDLNKMSENSSAPQGTIDDIKSKIKEIKQEIVKSSKKNLFGEKFIDLGMENVEKKKKTISTFHSAQDAVALANGEIGEILAQALIQLAAMQAEGLAEEAVKKVVENAVKTASEYGGSYNIKMALDSEGEAFSGENFLKLVDLPNASLSIKSHRGKIDTVIEYNFGNGLEKFNLSVKNYSSFSSDLTLVSGTPLNTVIAYIEQTRKKGILINSLINYNDSPSDNNIETKFLKIQNSAKKALKARILQDALQGYGETILNNKSMGYADIFVVFDNTNQKVKCISIPYTVAKFLNQRDKTNVKVQLNKVDIENFSGTEKVQLKHEDDQNQRLNKIYSAMNKEKIHASISNLERYILKESNKKT